MDSRPYHHWPRHTAYLGSCRGLALLFSSWLAFLSSLCSSRCLLLSLLQQHMPMLQTHEMQIDIKQQSITCHQQQHLQWDKAVLKTASVA